MSIILYLVVGIILLKVYEYIKDITAQDDSCDDNDI